MRDATKGFLQKKSMTNLGTVVNSNISTEYRKNNFKCWNLYFTINRYILMCIYNDNKAYHAIQCNKYYFNTTILKIKVPQILLTLNFFFLLLLVSSVVISKFLSNFSFLCFHIFLLFFSSLYLFFYQLNIFQVRG